MLTRQDRRKICVERAKNAIDSGTLEIKQALELSQELKEVDEFGYAWRLLHSFRKRALDEPLDLRFRQEIALCTYKDTHQNDEYRLARALEILDEDNHLKDSKNSETLGLAGAIHKRLWQIRNDKQELEASLQYYRRGHQADLENEFLNQGYPGINAAFVLDLLAGLERDSDGLSKVWQNLVAARHDEAKVIRNQIIDSL